jgi:hypothetical protein
MEVMYQNSTCELRRGWCLQAKPTYPLQLIFGTNVIVAVCYSFDLFLLSQIGARATTDRWPRER